jgi:hypothetical protein
LIFASDMLNMLLWWPFHVAAVVDLVSLRTLEEFGPGRLS